MNKNLTRFLLLSTLAGSSATLKCPIIPEFVSDLWRSVQRTANKNNPFQGNKEAEPIVPRTAVEIRFDNHYKKTSEKIERLYNIICDGQYQIFKDRELSEKLQEQSREGLRRARTRLGLGIVKGFAGTACLCAAAQGVTVNLAPLAIATVNATVEKASQEAFDEVAENAGQQIANAAWYIAMDTAKKASQEATNAVQAATEEGATNALKTAAVIAEKAAERAAVKVEQAADAATLVTVKLVSKAVREASKTLARSTALPELEAPKNILGNGTLINVGDTWPMPYITSSRIGNWIPEKIAYPAFAVAGAFLIYHAGWDFFDWYDGVGKYAETMKKVEKRFTPLSATNVDTLQEAVVKFDEQQGILDLEIRKLKANIKEYPILDKNKTKVKDLEDLLKDIKEEASKLPN